MAQSGGRVLYIRLTQWQYGFYNNLSNVQKGEFYQTYSVKYGAVMKSSERRVLSNLLSELQSSHQDPLYISEPSSELRSSVISTTGPFNEFCNSDLRTSQEDEFYFDQCHSLDQIRSVSYAAVSKTSAVAQGCCLQQQKRALIVFQNNTKISDFSRR